MLLQRNIGYKELCQYLSHYISIQMFKEIVYPICISIKAFFHCDSYIQILLQITVAS